VFTITLILNRPAFPADRFPPLAARADEITRLRICQKSGLLLC
jgi:hypothetical protein